MKPHILAVDDEEDILELVSFSLSREGYSVATAATGEAALAHIRDNHVDLIILDLMLPGIDGLEVCRKLKKDNKTEDIPIIMLSAKGEETDIVIGLELGADDYVAKPFSPKVLVARARAVLRRPKDSSHLEEETIGIDDLEINQGRRIVIVDGETIELTYSEFEILMLLARRPGWVYTRNQIIQAAHGEHYPVTDRSVDVQIVGLRKKLGPSGKMIKTVRGVGYKLNADDEGD
ncbi:MAG: response regulator transcription factor [Candidatus Marinimicrobia bacterium]|nr:response regulator transcription factor [Candidatus Neomarinimicrobiota bacterium]